MANSSKAPNLKIALIGPVAPYRGGIAQFTTELHQALSKHCAIQTISFKRLYPSWLYPGKSDKEPGRENYHLPDVKYLIDIYSPLSLRQTADRIVASGCQVAIVTWWTLIWQPGLAYLARRLKRRGVKVIFLCHNVVDHSSKKSKNSTGTQMNLTSKLASLAARILQGFSTKLLKQADGYIVLAVEAEKTLAALKPGAPILRRLHPIHQQFPAPNKKLDKRGRLELLFFGIVRPYKGLDLLVDALAELNDQEIYLTVAGEAWGDVTILQKQLQATGAPNLDLHFEYVDDQTAANYFARADVVVLPYRSATGSGVLSLAYNYRKPVLATSVGGLPDGIIEGRTGWLVPPGDPHALARAIADIRRPELAPMSAQIADFCQENSWDQMAQAVYELAATL